MGGREKTSIFLSNKKKNWKNLKNQIPWNLFPKSKAGGNFQILKGPFSSFLFFFFFPSLPFFPVLFSWDWEEGALGLFQKMFLWIKKKLLWNVWCERESFIFHKVWLSYFEKKLLWREFFWAGCFCASVSPSWEGKLCVCFNFCYFLGLGRNLWNQIFLFPRKNWARKNFQEFYL